MDTGAEPVTFTRTIIAVNVYAVASVNTQQFTLYCVNENSF